MTTVTLKGSPTRIRGELPKIGSKAPDFTLVDATLKERSLKDYQGKRKLISIVPSLDTPTCSLSAKKFNDSFADHPECVMLLVSADLPFAQKRVCGAEGLSNVISLSLMRSKKFAEDYGVLIEEGPLAGIMARAVVVLDENDRVLYTQLVPEIAEEPNYDLALKALV